MTLTGSIVAIATPMKTDFSIDWSAFEKLIEWHIDCGTNAIVMVGTTGESATLSHAENAECFGFAMRVVRGRIPIIAGTGANSTSEAIGLSKAAAAAGCDAQLSVVPYYNRPPQRGLIAHFSAIADCSDLPLILYNVPSRTACDLSVDSVKTLAQHPNIIGIKEASTLERLRELQTAVNNSFAVLTGEDALACQAIANGAAGVISVTANVAPKLMAQMACLAKTDLPAAQAIDAQLAGLHRALFCEANPIPVKWCLAQMKLMSESIRLPLLPLDAVHHANLRDAMQQADIDIAN